MPLAQRPQPVQAPALVVVLEELYKACRESAMGSAAALHTQTVAVPEQDRGQGTTQVSQEL